MIKILVKKNLKIENNYLVTYYIHNLPNYYHFKFYHIQYFIISILIPILKYPHCKFILIFRKLFFFQFIIFNIIEDCLFYRIHRIFHQKDLYKRFHYIHHEFTETFSLTGSVAHPVN
jgi:sterol desaturase/sphingolipid hydroxylase (fatty acid hydroxylase superfamily)